MPDMWDKGRMKAVKSFACTRQRRVGTVEVELHYFLTAELDKS